MITLKLAYRKLFAKGQQTLARLISLALGLAFGILLLSEALYYCSFENFYPDTDRLFVVFSNTKLDKNSEQINSYPMVSGAVAIGLKAEVPGIEEATQLTSIGSRTFHASDEKLYRAEVAIADEFFYDLLPRPMIAGKASEALKTPMTCIVSDKIAAAMGGEVLGKVIEMKDFPGQTLTIGGVFKSLPENSMLQYDILISMESIGNFIWDGRQNWDGNDRYIACVRVAKGVKPQNLAPAIRKMQEKHQDLEAVELKYGKDCFKYTLDPIRSIYLREAMDMILIISSIALAVLFVSLMNYLLLTLGTLVNRAKNSAIHKCCGAQSRQLHGLIFSETLLLFLLSLGLAFLIILAAKPFAESQLGHKLTSALSPQVIWPLVILMLMSIGLISYFPGRFFSRIPVVSALRDYRAKGNKWKLALLLFQFVGASFIITVSVVATQQYNKMIKANHGYGVQGVFYGYTNDVEAHKLPTIAEQLRALPEVERVAFSYSLPIYGASGNNILSPDGEQELFNIADFYYADENFLPILDIPVVEGSPYTADTPLGTVLISRKGADKLTLYNGWTDGVVGKEILITEHSNNANNPLTIGGVFPDFIIGSFYSPDNRPAVFFYLSQERFIKWRETSPSVPIYIFVKTRNGEHPNFIQKFSDILNTALPQPHAVVMSLAEQQHNKYNPVQAMRNAMMGGSIVLLLITTLGLAGYATSETARRRKELAIRKINGASLGTLLKMFVRDISYVALPATILGLAAAKILLDIWMENFAVKAPTHWWIFALCGIFNLMVFWLIAVANHIRQANQNPVISLQSE